MKDVFAYIKHLILNNKLLSAVAGYMIFSVLLLLFTGIDICIPCIWTTLTGHNCYGCGLTRAFLRLLTFDIIGAYHFNPLIFILLPGAIVFFVMDFVKWRKTI